MPHLDRSRAIHEQSPQEPGSARPHAASPETAASLPAAEAQSRKASAGDNRHFPKEQGKLLPDRQGRHDRLRDAAEEASPAEYGAGESASAPARNIPSPPAQQF